MLASNSRNFRVISIAVLIAMLGATIYMLFRQHWQGATVLALFLGLSLYVLTRKSEWPALFKLLFILAVLANAAGYVWNLFDRLSLYDEFAHLYTSFAVTLALGYLLYSDLLQEFRPHRLLFLLTIASMGIALGVAWEVIEWCIEELFAKDMIGPTVDTIGDLVLDSAGAILAALLNLQGLNNSARSPE